MWKLPKFVTEEDLTDKPLIVLLILASVLQTSITYSDKRRPRLANQDVVALVEYGLPENLVVRAINATEQEFDLCPQGLRDLKKAGVSDNIVDAMLRKSQLAPEEEHEGAAARPVPPRLERLREPGFEELS